MALIGAKLPVPGDNNSGVNRFRLNLLPLPLSVFIQKSLYKRCTSFWGAGQSRKDDQSFNRQFQLGKDEIGEVEWPGLR
jgi:hypothetical protein